MTKIYKNPKRNIPDNVKSYVPQYQMMGIEPQQFHSALSPSNQTAKIVRPEPLPLDNPRAPRPLIRSQPYAEPVPSPVGRGKGLLPNVGNNMEQSWSSVDGEIIDDLTPSIDSNQLIDNNDYVTPEALGLSAEEYLEVEDEEVRTITQEVTKKNFMTQNELQRAIQQDDLMSIINELPEDEYLLIVNGLSLSSSNLEETQEQVRNLVFGENPMSLDDIVVIKRVKIKVGLFLE